ncbi:TPA: hypothetical protein DDZ49_01750 [Candidatus Wolfebacteria bacterium]|uniref:Uncharacterized protein n=2 Tax=Candidatus Wolfeibacteriota TaxID=1752735 RepID=A0A0G4ATQ1_9BACT|nr:MAG: hypothetical protein UX70_C0001G0838 [Candidatus Wolfebacteria bacterium GW2011_GWB1_47_1]KKU42125.1 MAG: hypothetical protein UX58_C0003G0049 [Candidatus Wolfebacteria bacterium GW2011_GWB2_46_69]KKU54099.1 MAG: hypothetical protein UX76_C0006G0065 [Candidatus Wolfebacteria bacterium GW2011_GWC1_47_103]KKU59286.1 MAG: hypothetical protein UX83_C0006G0056 [Candidatus Wolfebacteria bacterium GW2011_GWE2_47_12]HAL24923.1 hypothetical protein [Candidatus Wolfebacteria bacterium]
MGIMAKNGYVLVRLDEANDVWESIRQATRETTRISREKVFRIASRFENLIFELTPEEEADLLAWGSQTIKQRVEDRFVTSGFTWAEMERWVANCYLMRINPLPTLRRLCEPFALPVYYRKDTELFFDPLCGLLCVETKDYTNQNSVRLTVFGTFEDLRKELAEIARVDEVFMSIREHNDN